MFFDTPWTRLSDSQKQGKTKNTRIISGFTASQYFAIGPVRSLTDKKKYDRYNRYGGGIFKPSYWKREDESFSRQRSFIKINGKEIF